jgi:hypothetical protein
MLQHVHERLHSTHGNALAFVTVAKLQRRQAVLHKPCDATTFDTTCYTSYKIRVATLNKPLLLLLLLLPPSTAG